MLSKSARTHSPYASRDNENRGKELRRSCPNVSASNADPTLGAAYLGLGEAYNSLGRFKEALAPLARLDAILPGEWVADYETAVAHLGIGESEAALQDIMRAERVRSVDRQSRSALSYLRAIARLQMNDYRRVKADLEEVTRLTDSRYKSGSTLDSDSQSAFVRR